jgi:formamidopyrimidine-DNA glycosylase
MMTSWIIKKETLHMIELPEAVVLSNQLTETVKGKIISTVVAAHTDHKMAWYYGNPGEYHHLLQNRSIDGAHAYGGFVEISAGPMKVLYNDGINLRFFPDNENMPPKHQLLLEFTDSSILCAWVHMYGGMGCFVEGEFDNEYYSMAKEKPSPLSREFDETYFNRLISSDVVQKLSVKAFLATKQRIPGLGNGVLQDILYNAKIHPKRKIHSLTEAQKSNLFNSIKNTLKQMVENNGRHTERDLFSKRGGYMPKLGRHAVGTPCEVCDSLIVKESYMGGSIYYCRECQIP